MFIKMGVHKKCNGISPFFDLFVLKKKDWIKKYKSQTNWKINVNRMIINIIEILIKSLEDNNFIRLNINKYGRFIFKREKIKKFKKI